MIGTNGKFFGALLLALGMASGGAVALAQRASDSKESKRGSDAERPGAHDDGKPPSEREPLVVRGDGKDEPPHHGDRLPPGAVVRLGPLRWLHAHRTADLSPAISPDSKTVVTIGDGILKRWETATGKLLGRFPGVHLGPVLFAPNGRWLIGHGGNLLDATSGDVVRRLDPGGMPVAFSPDSSVLATGAADGTVTLWNSATGEATHKLRNHEQHVFAGAFSSDGRTLITLCMGMEVCHWDVANAKLRRSVSLPLTTWRNVCLSPDGLTLAVSRDQEVSLWDTTTGEHRGQLGEDAANARYGLAFSKDGRTLATDWFDPRTREAQFCIWDVANRKRLRKFPIPTRALGFLSFCPDNRTLVSSGVEPRVRLWDTVTGRPLHEPAAHTGPIAAIAFTPDGKLVLSGSDDGTLRVWDAVTGRNIRELPGHSGGVTSLTLTPDGRAVLSGGYDARLLLQEWQTGKEQRRLVLVPKEELSPNESFAPHVSLAPDGRTAVASIGATDGGSLLHVWDPTDGRELQKRRDRSAAPFAAFSPDARILATYVISQGPAAPPKNPNAKAGGSVVVDKQVVLQDVMTGRPRLGIPLPEPNGSHAVFSPDARTLVTYGYQVRTDAKGSRSEDHVLHLWEFTTGQERITIRAPKETIQSGYEKIAFSPDGRILAAARKDLTIQVWDVATGAELLSRTGYETAVHCLAFRPDGKVLASGHRDSSILLWNLTDGVRLPKPRVAPSPQHLEKALEDLASADARKANAALWELVAAPERAVPLLASRLSPAARPPADKLRKLLADLDSDTYVVREGAFKQLADFGDVAEPSLEEALKASPSAEKRRRIEQLLAAPSIVKAPEQLRALRGVEVLERIGNTEARRVLERIAKGAPEARLTREAGTSLERLLRTGASP